MATAYDFNKPEDWTQDVIDAVAKGVAAALAGTAAPETLEALGGAGVAAGLASRAALSAQLSRLPLPLGPYQVAGINTAAGLGSGNPKDISGNGNHLVQKAGLSDAQLWANPGYISVVSGSDGYVYLPNSAFSFVMGVDSLLMGVVVNDAAPAAMDNIMGCANASTRAGFYISRRVGGAIRVITTTTGEGAINVQGSDTNVPFYDGTPHHLAIGIDGPTRSVFIWRDGVPVKTELKIFPTGGGRVVANFGFGRSEDTGATGTSIASKYARPQFLRFLDQGLPHNVNGIVARMVAGELPLVP